MSLKVGAAGIAHAQSEKNYFCRSPLGLFAKITPYKALICQFALFRWRYTVGEWSAHIVQLYMVAEYMQTRLENIEHRQEFGANVLQQKQSAYLAREQLHKRPNITNILTKNLFVQTPKCKEPAFFHTVTAYSRSVRSPFAKFLFRFSRESQINLEKYRIFGLAEGQDLHNLAMVDDMVRLDLRRSFYKDRLKICLRTS